ncbi:MAG TPA: hypothetical protein VM164_00940 [Burkholderiales bacterium]|nr:hypothetical protein [Burkholderiales bacterium]
MAQLIAGRFETRARADEAIAALKTAGFASSEITSFYVTPPGQHATYPIGGDAHHDEGTKDSGRKAGAAAAIGGVTGLALGAATAASLGEPGLTAAGAIAGTGIGGYVGSLAGGLMGTRSGNPEHASTVEPVERSSGVMVAVCIDRPDTDTQAVTALRGNGAIELERATGEWRDGAWVDFDARRTPDLIDGGDAPQGPAGPRP